MRESEKFQEPTPEKPDRLPCERCGSPRGKGQYRRVEGKVVCHGKEAEAYCRQRVLSKSLGIDLFTRYPRDRTRFEMDCRPKDAKKGRNGWKSIFSDDARVMAGWIYYSWAYPVGLAYAVQLDADNDLMKDYARPGEFVEMTHEVLAADIGMPRQSVTRSTGRLVARKMLRVDDDGRTCPVAMPEITDEEREAANEADVHALGEAPNTIPRKYRHLLNDLLSGLADEGSAGRAVREQIERQRAELERAMAEAQEEFLRGVGPLIAAIPKGSSRTDARDIVVGLCTAYNGLHKGIRTVRDAPIEQVCTRIASLLSRAVTFRSSSSPAVVKGPEEPPAKADGVVRDDDEHSPKELYEDEKRPGADRQLREDLYDAGEGKGKMAKLPAKPLRPAALIHARMQHWLGSHVIDMVIPEEIWQKAKSQGWTPSEVCMAVEQKGPLCVKKPSPAGFLRTAVLNLLIPEALAMFRQQAADNEAERFKAREADERHSAARGVAQAREAAFHARWTGMSDEDREARITRSLDRLTREAKGAGPGKKGKPSEWQRWVVLTAEIKRSRAESAAMRELREEMDSDASATGGQ